jgi:hypothetical protein
MQSLPIIEPLNEVFDILLQLFHRRLSAAVDLLVLERTHERFTISVLPRPRRAAHANKHAGLFQSLHIFVTSILSASIRVMYEVWARLSISDRLVQRAQWQAGLQTAAQ